MDSVNPTAMKVQTDRLWPWSTNTTVGVGLAVALWLGVVIGSIGGAR